MSEPTEHHIITYQDDDIGKTWVDVYHDRIEAEVVFAMRLRDCKDSREYVDKNRNKGMFGMGIFVAMPTMTSIVMPCVPEPVSLLDGAVRTITTIWGEEVDACPTIWGEEVDA